VLVPLPDDESSPKPGRKAKEPVFERSDFDEIFAPLTHKHQATGPAEAPAAAAASAPAPLGDQTEAAFDVEPAVPTAPLPPPKSTPAHIGIWLSPMWVTVLSVGVVAALALAFTAGLLVGLFLLRNNSEATASLGDRASARSAPALVRLAVVPAEALPTAVR
jgi:hypothetical protein